MGRGKIEAGLSGGEKKRPLETREKGMVEAAGIEPASET